jgi:hypothetical protein
MADRTSAALFGRMFEFLADPTADRQALANQLWRETGEYDFNAYQMYCDDALIKLGLAHKGTDPEDPDRGEFVIYKDGR